MRELTLGNARAPCVTKKSEKAPTCPYFYEEKNPENRSDEGTADLTALYTSSISEKKNRGPHFVRISYRIAAKKKAPSASPKDPLENGARFIEGNDETRRRTAFQAAAGDPRIALAISKKSGNFKLLRDAKKANCLEGKLQQQLTPSVGSSRFLGFSSIGATKCCKKQENNAYVVRRRQQ